MSVTSTGIGDAPINQVININQPSKAAPSTGDSLGANAFLTLLTTELQNQDPTSPQDPTQSVTQLAQFSQLQYTQQLASSFAGFQANFGVLQSSSLLGQSVTASTGTASTGAASSTVTGTVTSISVQNGQPYFTMSSGGKPITDSQGNPLLFATTQIIGIAAAGAATSGSTGTGA